MRFEIPMPGPGEFESGILRFYTPDGTAVCRADGFARVDFEFLEFRLSAIGDQMAWLAPADWETSELVATHNSEPGSILQLTDTLTGHTEPVTPELSIVDFEWAPDQTSIWLGTGGDAERILFHLDLCSRTLTEMGPGVRPLPSPDGRFVAYMGFEPSGVYLLDVRSGETHWIADGMPSCWSPDSSKISVLQTVAARWQLFVASISGAITHVAPDSQFTYWPSWCPDSRHLVFETCLSGRAGPPSQIAMASATGGPMQYITQGPTHERPRHHPNLPLVAFQERDPSNRAQCEIYVHSLESGRRLHLGRGEEPEWIAPDRRL